MQAMPSLISDEENKAQSKTISAPPRRAVSDLMAGIVTALFTISLVLLVMWRFNPPDPVTASAPPSEFSAYRALDHIQAIARSPRPIGSDAHAKVRDYIQSYLSSIGIEAAVQEANVVSGRISRPIPAATVRNVVGRLKGEDSTKAVLLVAHYDSAANSPGASDDGSGVAAILESARALRYGPTLRNDVIVLFTDGEESGLLGASAFVAEHPWAKHAGMVLNFEARGSNGPALMFETSSNNGWLIEGMAESSSYPFASSYMYDIYKMLPNDTDLSVFVSEGIAGLNFAYINGTSAYHSTLDNIENLSLASLQHQGSYALELTRVAGNADLSQAKEGDAVYFDILGAALIYYPAYWIAPLSIIVGLLFAVVLTYKFKKKQITLRGMALGALAMLSCLCVAVLISIIAWQLASLIHRGRGSILLADTLSSKLYFLAMISFTVAISSLIYNQFRKKAGVENLLAGGLLWWVAAMFLTTFLLPGASYLFTIPPLFAIVLLAAVSPQESRERLSVKLLLSALVCSVPAIILILPTILTVYAGLGLRQAAVPLALLALLIGLSSYQILLITRRDPRLMPAALLVLGVGSMIWAALQVGYGERLKNPVSLFYAFDADDKSAIWGSFDLNPGEWTRQFFHTAVERKSLREFFPYSSREVLTSPAPSSKLPPPEVSVLSDNTDQGERMLRMRVSSPRQAPIISIYISNGNEILSAAINGKPLQDETMARSKDLLALRYYATPREGIELTLKTRSGPLAIRVVDQSYGLPELVVTEFDPRPENFMPSPFSHFNQDSIMIGRSFSL